MLSIVTRDETRFEVSREDVSRLQAVQDFLTSFPEATEIPLPVTDEQFRAYLTLATEAGLQLALETADMLGDELLVSKFQFLVPKVKVAPALDSREETLKHARSYPYFAHYGEEYHDDDFEAPKPLLLNDPPMAAGLAHRRMRNGANVPDLPGIAGQGQKMGWRNEEERLIWKPLYAGLDNAHNIAYVLRVEQMVPEPEVVVRGGIEKLPTVQRIKRAWDNWDPEEEVDAPIDETELRAFVLNIERRDDGHVFELVGIDYTAGDYYIADYDNIYLLRAPAKQEQIHRLDVVASWPKKGSAVDIDGQLYVISPYGVHIPVPEVPTVEVEFVGKDTVVYLGDSSILVVKTSGTVLKLKLQEFDVLAACEDRILVSDGTNDRIYDWSGRLLVTVSFSANNYLGMNKHAIFVQDVVIGKKMVGGVFALYYHHLIGQSGPDSGFQVSKALKPEKSWPTDRLLTFRDSLADEKTLSQFQDVDREGVCYTDGLRSLDVIGSFTPYRQV